MINLASQSTIIQNDESLIVYRDSEVIYTDGKPSKLGQKKFLIACNVQPLSGQNLLMVPEGDRYKEAYSLYIKDAPIRDNDRVEREGKYFQVQNVKNWGNHQEATMMLIDTGAYSND